MQFLTIAITLFSTLALALPSSDPIPKLCVPATYNCSVNAYTGCPGWSVCDVDGTWKFGGDCPPGTHCIFNELNKSPYCI